MRVVACSVGQESCRELLQLQRSIIQENKNIVEAEKERQNELNEKFQASLSSHSWLAAARAACALRHAVPRSPPAT